MWKVILLIVAAAVLVGTGIDISGLAMDDTHKLAAIVLGSLGVWAIQQILTARRRRHARRNQDQILKVLLDIRDDRKLGPKME